MSTWTVHEEECGEDPTDYESCRIRESWGFGRVWVDERFRIAPRPS